MTWLSTEQAAKLEECSERTLRRNKDRYGFRLVNGAGGECGTRYEFLLESLSASAQARYHGEQEEKSANELFPYQGQRVYARYNTDDVRQVYIVSEEGEFICMAESKELGCLDKELTAQGLRKLNAEKKTRRKQARSYIPDIAIPSVQQLAIESGRSFSKPDLKLLPTALAADTEREKTAQTMQTAQERQSAQREKYDKSKGKNRERDDAYFNLITGGGLNNAVGE